MVHQNSDLRMGKREWGLLLILSVLWGGSFFFFKVLVAEFPPFTVVLGRVGVAALALNAVLLLRRDPMPTSPRLWLSFLVMGVLNNVVPYTLIVVGETRISSGLASILNATTPIFTVLVAHASTLDEKLTWQRGVGVLFGLLGVMALIGPGVVSGFGESDTMGELCCLLAALVYAFAGIYGRRFRDIAPMKIATGQITASTAILIPVTMAVDHPWMLPSPSLQALSAWVGIALLSTALAYVIYFRILAVAGAVNLLLVTFLVPVSALLLGVAFLGEHITSGSLGGMALIGLGLAAIDGRLWTAATRRWCPAARLRKNAGNDPT